MKFSKQVLSEFPVIFYKVMEAMAMEKPFDISQRYRDMEFELVNGELVFSKSYVDKYHTESNKK